MQVIHPSIHPSIFVNDGVIHKIRCYSQETHSIVIVSLMMDDLAVLHPFQQDFTGVRIIGR